MKYQVFVKNIKIKMGGAGSSVVGRRRGGLGIVSETFCMTSSLAHPSGRLAHYSN